jgi:hypothetical protein
MAIIGSTQFLERIQFFNGERLFAADLQAIEAFNREMRWLHNQSLHQPGVGSGYIVTGNIGDRQVVISPGYALDSCGREIILTESQTLAIPPKADNGDGGSVFYDLTVSYPSDSELTPSETQVGICSPTPGVVRLREAPIFCWVQLCDDPTNRQPMDPILAKRIKTGLFIVLGQVEILNCQLKQPVSIGQRRNARPALQPYVASGSAPAPLNWVLTSPLPGETAIAASPATFGTFMYAVEIDTRAEGFQSTPDYAARISGSRVATAPSNGQTFFLDAFLNIPQNTAETPAILTPQTFTLQIFPFVVPASNAPGTVSTVEISDVGAAISSWNVVWIGVED